VWVGNDSRESLGEKETGAVTALPIWINFMRAAIAGKDDEEFPGDEPGAALNRAGSEPSDRSGAASSGKVNDERTQARGSARALNSRPKAQNTALPVQHP